MRCTDEAPCGKVAAAVLADNDITAEPASLEEDVRATLDKVVSGEADAGLVYATDAVAAGEEVEAIEIPGAESALTSYFVTVLDQSEDARPRPGVGRLRHLRGRPGRPRAGRVRHAVTGHELNAREWKGHELNARELNAGELNAWELNGR